MSRLPDEIDENIRNEVCYMAKKRLVLTLGHLALGATLPEQKAAVTNTAKYLADLIQDGFQIVITHGNTQQVDMIHTAMNEFSQVHPEYTAVPMAICAAMCQGYIGYDLQNAIRSELISRGIYTPVSTILTQVTVNPHDESTYIPYRLIGRKMTAEEAKREGLRGNDTVETEDGYRRVVISPKPVAIVEIDAINAILDADQPVIAAGGGGIPVIKKDGTLMGTAAAIDKDLTAAVLAKEVNADVLMYLTDVDNIVLNYGSDSEIPLYELSAKEAEDHIKAGSFAAGTMDPKVRGGIDFVQTGTNRKVIITTLEKARAALDGKAGTVIY